MTKFVILTTQRSGSIWLMSLLDSHEAILCAGEVFKSGKRALAIRYSEYSFTSFCRRSIGNRLLKSRRS